MTTTSIRGFKGLRAPRNQPADKPAAKPGCACCRMRYTGRPEHAVRLRALDPHRSTPCGALPQGLSNICA